MKIKEVIECLKKGEYGILSPLLQNETSGLFVYFIRYLLEVNPSNEDIALFQNCQSRDIPSIISVLKKLSNLNVWDEQSQQQVNEEAQIIFPLESEEED